MSHRSSDPDLPVLLAAGTRAGFGAAVVMNLPMLLQTDGFTPARIAASVLRGTDPDEVSQTDAALAHHGAGALAGVLFALAYTAIDARFERQSTVDDLSVPAYPLAIGFVVAFVYTFFARLVLPHFGADARDRASVVRRTWLASSIVYGLALAASVPRELTSAEESERL